MPGIIKLPAVADAAIQRFAGLTPFPQPEYLRLRYPVVLMHGFGVLASIRRGGHLHEEAMSLRSHGIAAFAPNVAPYTVVPTRAAMWKERIERVLEETDANKVNLIAHSMGGLDARYLISRMGMHSCVASLSTISTPHRGTEVATFTLKQPERLRGLVASLVNWVGATALVGCEADVERCVVELTPSFVKEQFNPSVPDHPHVRYWSWAGAAGRYAGSR